MRHPEEEKSGPGRGVDGTLARLLAAEELLAAKLDAARAQAAEILRTARDDANRLDREGEAMIEARAAALAAEYDARLLTDLDAIRRESAQALERCRAVDVASERTLVRYVIERLMPVVDGRSA